MGAVITVFIMAAIFLLLSLFLFRGKGSWLIAGYNTASPAEKAKYDVKKLCRAMGGLCLLLALLLCAMGCLAYQVESGTLAESAMGAFGLVFSGAVLAAIGFLLWYCNNRCRK